MDDKTRGITWPETADVDSSTEAYARRFAGPAGQWMLGVQERIVTGWLMGQTAATVLDVGGGHGQLAIPLANRGCRVTVLGSDASCRGRLEREIQKGQIQFVTGNLLELPFADRTFDVATSVRILPHLQHWPPLIRELCRVARERVILDYPALYSINLFYYFLFGLKKRIEKNTRTFLLFRHDEIAREFARYGFAIRRRKAQFFLPMVLHRMLKSPRLSGALEGTCCALGLTAAAGSPILVEAARKELK